MYENVTRLDGYGEALEAALDEVRLHPASVLDIATGTGFAATRLKQRFPDAEVRGVDTSEEMLGIAQHQAVADSLTIEYTVASSAELPFEDGYFDLAVILNGLVEPEEMLRVVAPGGRALVVYSFAGPWVNLAWPALSGRFEAGGAEYLWGRRAGPGFFGVARKPGASRSRT